MFDLQKYLELQHQADIDDVKNNCDVEDFPEDISTEKADELLYNPSFIEEVANCYRTYLDNDDKWYYILKDALKEVAQEYL